MLKALLLALPFAGHVPHFLPHAAWLGASTGPVTKAPAADYPGSCFRPGLLPGFEQSYVEGTTLFEYEAEVIDQQNPQALRAPVAVRAWRAPCHFQGSALLIEFRPLGGLPLAPAVGLRQGEIGVDVRLSYEANTRITDDTGAIIPVFPERDGRTVFVVGATPASEAAGVDFDGELELLIRHRFFDAVLPFPAYDPVAFGVFGPQPIHPRHSGSWYAPARDGEGVVIEVFERDDGVEGVFLSWYTYRNGLQQWLVGSAELGEDRSRIHIPLVRTTGADFGAAFRAADVQREAWGSASLSFPGCSRLQLDYDGADGAGRLELVRLTTLADFECR